MEKFCVANNRIWYVNALVNGLFAVDLLSGEVSYIGIVEEKEKYLKRAYSEILYYEDCLYMIPYNASSIGIYHIVTKQFNKILVPEKTNEKFYEAVLLGDKIYMLPYKAKKFYCLDTRTKILSEIRELNNIGISVFSSTVYDGGIWFPKDGGKSLYCYQPENSSVKKISLDKISGRFSSVGRVKDKIIVTAIDRALALIIDPQTENIMCMEFEKYSKVKGARNYYITEYQNKAIIVRIGSNDCVVINTQNGEIKEQCFCSVSLKMYGKVWKTNLEIVMLPTLKDKAFRFLDGRTFFLNDRSALLAWGERNNFQWKDFPPMPDLGIEELIQIIN